MAESYKYGFITDTETEQLPPGLFPFSTSSWVIRSFIKVVASKRHSKELQQYLSSNFLEEVRKQIKK